MACRPRGPSQNSEPLQGVAEQPSMSMLAMAPPPFSAFRHEFPTSNGMRSPERPSYRNEANAVALPSIRQAFPDLLDLAPPSRGQANDSGALLSPQVMSPATRASFTSAEYTHSSPGSKRRRLSVGDDSSDGRPRQVPRLYMSPGEMQHRQSPEGIVRQPHPPPTDSWNTPQASPYLSANGPPNPVEVHDGVDYRPSIPTLPPRMALERDNAVSPAPLRRMSDGRPDVYLGHQQLNPHPRADYPAPYQGPGYAASYPPGPPSFQGIPTTPRPYERSPFTAGGYSQHYHQDLMRYGDLGGLGMDAKHRKRRGNLPKETTDKLRAWFVAHLQHPYPTEDEKQELMRQTGLQMNQISNWFINARRRQLPAMMNTAQAEQDAMNARTLDGKTLTPMRRSNQDLDTHRGGLMLSDDEDIDAVKRQGEALMKRGSV